MLAVLVFMAACGDDGGDPTPTPSLAGGIVLGSDDIEQGSGIPDAYSCVAQNQSPPLTWLNAPDQTQFFALVMDDPDADGFVHWVVYDIPGDRTDLPIDIPQGDTIDGGGKQGENSAGDIGYTGPCPPEGQTHTYRFRLYALAEETGLDPGASFDQVLPAIETHSLDQGQLTAMFGR
jgi:Raf kinase inhibitor-like YbhB/YbcL family protein